jgi:prepilin-type N-terminal cleavage/methylation domain-containing protein
MNKEKGFTLIELLVVVAIIGILAAIGVVAYNGYTSSAKIRIVKQNYNDVKKYISTEFLKCDIGLEIQAKEKYLSNPSKYKGWGDRGCDRIPGNQYNAKFVYVGGAIISYVHNFEEDFGFKNPFNSNDKYPINQDRSCPLVQDVGRVNAGIDEAKNLVFICARFGTEDDDIIQTTLPNPY